MEKSLILLTYNEIEAAPKILGNIPWGAADEAFAVDGGSRDGTVDFLRSQGLPVHVQERRGRGEAFRLAARRAKGDHLVFFSPDGNEDPADIPRLFTLLAEGCDMAIASRFLPGAANEEDAALVPARKWANKAFTRIANALWNRGRYVSDAINGFRGVSSEAFRRMAPDAEGFVIEYQLSIRAMKLGLRIGEIPTREGARLGGRSTATSVPTGLAALRLLAREIRVGAKFS